MEILAPIKSLKNAKIAVNFGADAIYLASPSFGARVNAALSLEEIQEIINFCKGYNVKCYVTFNTIVFDDEIETFFKELDEIYLYGMDAIIIQDFAFVDIIKKFYPDLEVHASTQMHVHNTDGVNIMRSLGVNRVVVPREMSFANIDQIKAKNNIEIESFVHGALCVSYSGQCYDSTLLDQKSANRGRCSQYCRMPSYVYHKRHGNIDETRRYPLNLKDLNNLDLVDKYREVGVDSLKIEGRLKGIDYVGYLTDMYTRRNRGEQVDSLKLESVYNREFSTGRINSRNGAEIVNLKRPNNTGQFIGSVEKVIRNDNDKLRFYNYKIYIKTNYKLIKGDNLRFIFGNDECGCEIEQMDKEGNSYVVYSNSKAQKGYKVYRTKDYKKIDEYEKIVQDIERQREKIFVNISICKDKVKYEIISDKKVNEISSELEVMEAKNNPLKKEGVIEVLAKTKNTNYDIVIKEISIDSNIFMRNKDLKLLRDDIIAKYSSIKDNRKSREKEVLDYIYSLKSEVDMESEKASKEYYISVRSIEQIKYFVNLDISNFDFNINILVSHLLVEEKNYSVIEEIKNKYKTYLVMPRVVYDDESDECLKYIDMFDNFFVSEIGSLKYKDLVKGDIISNFTFNTTNFVNKKKLEELGAKETVLSIELNNQKIDKFSPKNSIINIYGAIPVMLMDYCPINLDKKDGCGECRLCRSGNYYIKDELGRKFSLVYEGNDRIGLYTNEVLSMFDEMDKLAKFNSYYVNLVLEKEVDIDRLINSMIMNENKIINSFLGNYYKNVL